MRNGLHYLEGAARSVALLTSGFDPYTLEGGQTGPALGSAGNNIRHGNLSGATALSLTAEPVQEQGSPVSRG